MTEIPSIAVIGLSCRFPGADTPAEFWENLRNGVESISRFTQEELEASGADLAAARHPQYVPARGILRDAAGFDATLFGYSPREAEIMDPQHRVFLECAWEALEDAGYGEVPAGIRTGVFAGAGTNTYLFRNIIGNPAAARPEEGFQIFLGNDKDFIPTRVSYKLNLRGPSVSVTTACSSSLVAVHFACQSLLSFQCDMALAGAVSIQNPEKEGHLYREGGIHSSDGHCRAFDANADGTVGGNGAGVVILKRLEDAIAAGDAIRAIIRGSAINNDGSGKAGYTAPSVEGQAEVIAEAQAVAGISPDDVTYVEAHGTATPLGDPIEIEALTRAFRQKTNRQGYCAVGSVKTNIGHLDAAAGIAGLIKTILALQHREIPASLHYRAPNPRIPFQQTPFYVNNRTAPWNPPAARIAGVSSFGIGGTNAHIVLEEAPHVPPTPPNRPAFLLPLSARTPAALRAAAGRLAEFLERNPVSLADAAFTLSAGRRVFPYRAAITAATAAEASRKLRQLPLPSQPAADGPVAFVFPGQGAQRPNVGRALYQTEPIFRDAIEECGRILGMDLEEVLYSSTAAEKLRRTELAQPALFAVEYATARLFSSLGIEPQAMIGHSLGEYVAACVAGVFSLETALRLIALRGSLMASAAPGAMLAVPLSPAQIQPLLPGDLAIAAINAESRVVISGPTESIEALQSRLEAQRIACKRLPVSHAFHSAALDPILHEFGEAFSRTKLHAPRIPYVSNLTGTWITPEQATDPAYWVRHLRHTVRFAEGLSTLLETPGLVLIEAGPSSGLVPTAIHPLEGESYEDFLNAAGRLRLKPIAPGRRIPLPTYPFERQRFYILPGAAAQERTAAPDPEPALYTPSWKRKPLTPATGRPASWLIFADRGGLATSVAAHLNHATVIHPGPDFDPADPAHYRRVLAALPEPPQHIAHFLSEDGDLNGSFYSVFHLLRALGETPASSTRLYLVTSQVHDVTGAETIDPIRAAALSYVRVAPQEYPNLQCVNIDVQRTGDSAALQIAAELQAPPSDPIVAYRGRHRWVQIAEPLPTAAAAPSPWKPNGVYLITGGTGGIGKEIAAHLSRTAQAKVVLTSRNPVPPPPAFPTEAIPEREAALEANLGIRRLDSYPGLEERLNRLCTAHILRYLGDHYQPGLRIPIAELMRRLRVKPAFERLVQFFLRALCEDGAARIEDGSIEFLPPPADSAESLSRRLKEEFPGFRPTIELLDHCGAHYARALSGEIEAVSVLFPDGGSGLMLDAGRDTVEHMNGRVYRFLLRDLLAEALRNVKGRKIRILEIGAGNGVLTGDLLPILPPDGVEYYFTDLGKSFVRSAELRAAERGLRFMRFQTLDIAASPESQSIDPESFDFILGLDVVHATPNIVQTLSNLKRYLRPGGEIALLETVRVTRWNQMIFGLTTGWWHFDDPEIRLQDTPVLPVENWQAAFEAAGYTHARAYPGGLEARRATDSALVIASKPAHALTVQADVSSPSQMEDAVQKTIAAFGTIDGIIHCAAVDDQGSIQLKTPRFEQNEFAPKIAGTQVLAEIVARTQPDFLLLCSSLNTITGGPGQIGYVAANCYLDAFAHAHPAIGRTRVVSVDWDRWQGIGMAAAFEQWSLNRTGQPLLGGMTVPQGLAVLDRILANPTPPQVIVTKAQSFAAKPLPRTEPPRAPEAAAPPAASEATDPPQGLIEATVARIFEETLGVRNVSRNANFAELGGDSLIAIQVVSRLRDALQMDVPLRSLFEAPTIAALAESVAETQPMEEGVL